MSDLAYRMHLAAVARLRLAAELMDAADEGDLNEWPADFTAPYCGCDDCVVREALTAALGVYADGTAEEQREVLGR